MLQKVLYQYNIPEPYGAIPYHVILNFFYCTVRYSRVPLHPNVVFFNLLINVQYGYSTVPVPVSGTKISHVTLLERDYFSDGTGTVRYRTCAWYRYGTVPRNFCFQKTVSARLNFFEIIILDYVRRSIFVQYLYRTVRKNVS